MPTQGMKLKFKMQNKTEMQLYDRAWNEIENGFDIKLNMSISLTTNVITSSTFEIFYYILTMY